VDQTIINLVAIIPATLSAIAALVIAVLAARQVHAMRQENIDVHDWNRRKATVELASSLIQGTDYLMIRDELLTLGFDIKDPNRNSDELLAKLSDEDVRRADVLIIRLFNLFEDFLVALRHGVLDETIAKDYLMLFVVALYRKYEPWLKKENRLEGREGAFCEFLNYAAMWANEYEADVIEQENIFIYRSPRDAKKLIG